MVPRAACAHWGCCCSLAVSSCVWELPGKRTTPNPALVLAHCSSGLFVSSSTLGECSAVTCNRDSSCSSPGQLDGCLRMDYYYYHYYYCYFNEQQVQGTWRMLVSDFTQITLKVAATFEYELGLFCFQEAE